MAASQPLLGDGRPRHLPNLRPGRAVGCESARTAATSSTAWDTKAPHRLNQQVLAALCDVLDCKQNDPLQPVAETVKTPKTSTADTGPGIGAG